MNKNLTKMLEKYDIQGPSAGVSEPGYDDKPVMTANWNNIPAKVFNALEFMGYACEWDDAWIECDSCYKAFRCSPNSYDWQMYGHVFDGYAVCGDCMNWDNLFEEFENNPRKAITTSLLQNHKEEIESRYTLIQGGYENGLHPHQTDNPAQILASLLAKNPNGRYLFVMTGQGQFDIEFALYERKES